MMERFVLFCALVSAAIAASDRAPVVIWSNDQDQVLPATHAGHTSDETEFGTNYLGKTLGGADHNVIVFLQDHLSLDDITKHADVYSEQSNGDVFHNLKNLMETHHSSHLPSVSSPSDVLHKFQDSFNGLIHHVSDADSLAEVPLDRTKRNLVMVQLPSTHQGKESALSKIDSILGKMTKEISELGKPFTALYTGKSSSQVHGESFYPGRHLLSENLSTNGTFINLTNCVYLYMTDAVFSYNDAKFPLSKNPTKGDQSVCANNSAMLVLQYPDQAGLTGLSFSFSFSAGSGSWNLDYLNVTYNVDINGTKGSGTNSAMETSFLTSTPLGFSYHCYIGDMIYETSAQANSSTDGAAVQFVSLQVQAFQISGDKFGYYNDCVGFFTLPIWTGIIVTLILVAILTFGILMLMNIQTMDRFDDPKGKTITVNVME